MMAMFSCSEEAQTMTCMVTTEPSLFSSQPPSTVLLFQIASGLRASALGNVPSFYHLGKMSPHYLVSCHTRLCLRVCSLGMWMPDTLSMCLWHLCVWSLGNAGHSSVSFLTGSTPRTLRSPAGSHTATKASGLNVCGPCAISFRLFLLKTLL